MNQTHWAKHTWKLNQKWFYWTQKWIKLDIETEATSSRGRSECVPTPLGGPRGRFNTPRNRTMSRIYFCSSMLAGDTSSAMNVWPRPSPSWLDQHHPPPPRCAEEAAAVMCWPTNAASAGMDRQPRLFKWPFDSISAYCVEDKRDGNSFPREPENSLLFHFSQKIEVTCWIFSPGLILHQSKLRLSLGPKASDASRKQGLFFSALECHQFLLFCSYTDLTVVSQK